MPAADTTITHGSIHGKKLQILCGLLLTSILFFPKIRIGSNNPAIEVADLLLPIIAGIVILLRKEIIEKKIIWLILFFGFYIFLTMVINSRTGFKSDYFEIYKIVKFVLLICLFSFIDYKSFLKTWLKPLFIALVVVNLLHYFNVFNFNLFIQDIYFSNYNYYAEFGLNSAGVPHSKRMLGLVANPNNNAVIFSIFMVLFMPKKEISLKSLSWFLVALIMTLLCQSRTAMLAIPLVLIMYGILSGRQFKKTLTLTGTTILGFVLSYFITLASIGVGTPPNKVMIEKFIEKYPVYYWDEKSGQLLSKDKEQQVDYTYLESVLHGQFTEGTSMMGRYEIWLHLMGMIKEKPLFGHGPYKEYFYDNKYYAENEFIFMAWRYGLIGLLIFMTIMGWLAVKAYMNRHLDSASNLLMILILYAVTAMTNLPFSAITLNMLLAILIGFFFAQLRQKE